MQKKYPDNIVYNEKSGKFDSNTKYYPTTVGSQKFEPIVLDNSDQIKANKYFTEKLEEIKKEYEKLIREYETTNLISNLIYSFQPIVGQTYYAYPDKENKIFLSIIKPNEWNKECVGSYKLNLNGVWEEVNE
jgi:hypothetical protein